MRILPGIQSRAFMGYQANSGSGPDSPRRDGRRPDQSQRCSVYGSPACAGKPLAVQKPGEANFQATSEASR